MTTSIAYEMGYAYEVVARSRNKLTVALLQDILTLSKLDARLLEVAPTEVDPVETVKHALRLYQQECQNADVDTAIRINQSYNTLAVDRVLVDPSRLLQVLINLLGTTRFCSFGKTVC